MIEFPYKDREKQLAAKRESERRRQLKKKIAEEKAHMDRLDLNYGMKPLKDIFMSFEEFQKWFPEATKTQYIKYKIKFEQEHAEEERKFRLEAETELKGVLGLVPANPKFPRECQRFRNAYINKPSNFGEIHQNHHCRYCEKWLEKYKNRERIEGIDLFHAHEKPYSDRLRNERGRDDQDLQDLLRDV